MIVAVSWIQIKFEPKLVVERSAYIFISYFTIPVGTLGSQNTIIAVAHAVHQIPGRTNRTTNSTRNADYLSVKVIYVNVSSWTIGRSCSWLGVAGENARRSFNICLSGNAVWWDARSLPLILIEVPVSIKISVAPGTFRIRIAVNTIVWTWWTEVLLGV